jgi:hypothetical protein
MSADMDFAQMRDFQSSFEHLSRSKTFLHSLVSIAAVLGERFINAVHIDRRHHRLDQAAANSIRIR